MARDRANIRVDMWGDQDWRDLTGPAQRLYMQLLTHGTLNYAGVAEWRPGRLAAMTTGETSASIRVAGEELARKFFVVIDEDTEEVLVRSFVKHDGLLKQPKLVVSMTNAFSAIASTLIREVVAFEVQKMRNREPEARAWSVPQMDTVLGTKGTDVHTFAPGLTPAVTPGLTPTLDQAQGLPTSTTTTTTTNASHSREDAPNHSGKKASTRLPKNWAPTAEHIERANTAGVDVIAQAESFREHAETHDRHAANWNSAFTTWLKKSKPSQQKPALDPNWWMKL